MLRIQVELEVVTHRIPRSVSFHHDLGSLLPVHGLGQAEHGVAEDLPTRRALHPRCPRLGRLAVVVPLAQPGQPLVVRPVVGVVGRHQQLASRTRWRAASCRPSPTGHLADLTRGGDDGPICQRPLCQGPLCQGRYLVDVARGPARRHRDGVLVRLGSGLESARAATRSSSGASGPEAAAPGCRWPRTRSRTSSLAAAGLRCRWRRGRAVVGAGSSPTRNPEDAASHDTYGTPPGEAVVVPRSEPRPRTARDTAAPSSRRDAAPPGITTWSSISPRGADHDWGAAPTRPSRRQRRLGGPGAPRRPPPARRPRAQLWPGPVRP